MRTLHYGNQKGYPPYENNPTPYDPTNNYSDDYIDIKSKIYGNNQKIFEQLRLRKDIDNCILTPKPILYLNDMIITAVSTGTYHTIFLDKAGNVYGIGEGFGFNEGSNGGGTPKLILNNYHIAAIYSGNHHTIFLDIEGNAFGLCYNNDGILGGTYSKEAERERQIVGSGQYIKYYIIMMLNLLQHLQDLAIHYI
jgi:alpha-tubulin suppressor-like RCC1 family protein